MYMDDTPPDAFLTFAATLKLFTHLHPDLPYPRLLIIQALIARDIPLNTPQKRAATAHVIGRSLQLGVLVSAVLAITTVCNQEGVLRGMTASPEVRGKWQANIPLTYLQTKPTSKPTSH